MTAYRPLATCVAIGMISSQALGAPQLTPTNNIQAPSQSLDYASQPVKRLEHFLTAKYQLADGDSFYPYAQLFPEHIPLLPLHANSYQDNSLKAQARIIHMQTFYDRQISVSLIDGAKVTLHSILVYEIGSFTDNQGKRTFHIIRKFKPHPILGSVVDLKFTVFIEDGKKTAYILPENEDAQGSNTSFSKPNSLEGVVDEGEFKQTILKMMGR